MMSQERDKGKQAQDDRAGAQNGALRPLALALKPQMGADFLEGDFNAPASNHPGQDLQRVCALVGAEKGSGEEFVQVIAHEYPADWQRVMTRRVPQGDSSGNIQDTLASAVPGDLMPFPKGRGAIQAAFQGRLACSLLGLWATFSFGLGQWVVVQGSVQAQPRDESDSHAIGSTGQTQLHGGQATIHDQYQLVRREPASHHANHLSNPVNTGLVASPLLLVGFLRGCQHGQERQRPHARTEGNLHQEHHADPTQPIAVNNPFFAAARRIPKQALIQNTFPITSLQRLVGSQQQWHTHSNKRHHQQPQQNFAHFQAIPLGPRQYPMVVLILRFIAQSHYPQRCADRSLVRSQNCSHHQHFRPFKHALTEYWRKHSQQHHNLLWQDKHEVSFVTIGMSSAYPAPIFSSTKWIKSRYYRQNP